MFILVHKQEMGYDGGTHTKNLFVSDSEGVLRAREETIKENRVEANKLIDELVEEIDANPDPERQTPARRTNAEVERIRKLHEYLDKSYPLWYLSEGTEGESFTIEEIEIL